MTSTVRPRSSCSPGPQLPIDFDALEFLAHGTSGAVYAIDKDWVLKESWELDRGIVERQALGRLGSHPNIIGYFGEATPNSIVLERGIPLLSPERIGLVPTQKKLAWIRDVAEGLLYIHQQGIIHADVGCENIVIVDGQLKIIDFEGCSMDGKEATAGYKWYNRKDDSVTLQSDIFAYGCVVYQILTGRPTFHELTESDDRSNLVRRRCAQHRFPDIQGLLLSDVILRCWSGSFKSMAEVISALDSTSTRLLSPPRLTSILWKWVGTCLRSKQNGTCSVSHD